MKFEKLKEKIKHLLLTAHYIKKGKLDYNIKTKIRFDQKQGNNSDRLTVKLGLKLSQLIDVVSFKLTFITQEMIVLESQLSNKRRAQISLIS